MGARDRIRQERIAAGLELPFRNDIPQREPMLRCGKCHTILPYSRAANHLKECQPNGATCGKCGKSFKPDEFIPHFVSCIGKPVEVIPT